jgi:hypothetical protein
VFMVITEKEEKTTQASHLLSWAQCSPPIIMQY